MSGASVDRLTGESRASHRYTPQQRACNELSFNESTTNYYYLIHHTHTHTPVLRPYVRDYSGEPVPSLHLAPDR